MIEPLTFRNAPTADRRDMISRSITVRAATINEEERSVEAVLSTETRALVFDWQRYEPIEEILIAGGARFDAQVTFLENHSRYELANVLGSIRSVRIEGQQVVGRLHFSQSNTRAVEAWNMVREGHLTDVSIGYRAEQFTDIEPNTTRVVNGKSYTAGARRLRVTTAYRIREGSLVPIGADQAAKIRADAGLAPFQEQGMNPQLRQYLLSLGLRADATDEQAADFRSLLSNEQSARAEAIEAGREQFPAVETRSDANPPPPRIAPDTRPTDEDVRTAERNRIEGIRALAAPNTPPELVQRAINENMTPEAAGLLILRHERQQFQATPAPFAIHSRNHDRDCEREALAAGLLLRTGSRVIDPNASEATRRQQEQNAERGERYRDLSLVDVCREACRISQARDPETGAEPWGRESWIRSAISTPSLSYIFTTSVNARLLASYEEAPDSTDGWVYEADIANFLQQERIGLGKVTGLKKLGKGGTAQHATTDDTQETYKIARYAEQMVIDEQDIINDNVDAFVRLPMEFGMAAARVRPDLVYAILLANAALSDSVALFHASHANLTSGGSSALSATSLKAGIVAMGKQTTSINGETIQLNIVPRYLLVPQDLVFTARELVRSTQIIIAGTAGSVTERGNANTIADLDLQIRVDNRLGTAGVTDPSSETAYTGSATNWFLSADPVAGRTIEVGYLAGTNRRPRLRRFTLEKGQWGVGWDINLDIGAKALGAKGLYKSAGA